VRSSAKLAYIGLVIRAILLDIEGTTSSLAFVREVLFPHAREHLAVFVQQSSGNPELEALLAEVQRLAQEEGASQEAPLATLQRWMAEDRKLTPLKALQGWLWEDAFRREAFVAHVYPEVSAVLAEWRERGLPSYIFSSGSVRAQQAFFRHSAEGDLTPLIAGWFDTSSGGKQDPAAYARIASALRLDPAAVLFVSDSQAELDAARAAGLATLGMLRDGLRLGGHPATTRLDELPLSALPPLFALPALPAINQLAAARRSVVELARYCHARGWADATSGNFSERVADGHFVITTSGVDKGLLTPAEVVHVDGGGLALEPGTPSAETPLHAALYASSAKIGAITHTHSVAATVLSRHHAEQGSVRLSGYEMAKALAPVQDGVAPDLCLPILPNQQDTRALAQVVSQRLRESPAFGYLIAGHGLTTWGNTPAQARRHVEALEFLLACELSRL
jgi:2,3-diketo-5-methylthio-1-phosphopentane phosphatase/methylthioribulose-1-phosphate dehydratase